MNNLGGSTFLYFKAKLYSKCGLLKLFNRQTGNVGSQTGNSRLNFTIEPLAESFITFRKFRSSIITALKQPFFDPTYSRINPFSVLRLLKSLALYSRVTMPFGYHLGRTNGNSHPHKF